MKKWEKKWAEERKWNSKIKIEFRISITNLAAKRTIESDLMTKLMNEEWNQI